MAKQIIVNTENKSIDVSIEARSNIELVVSRAVSSGVTQINAGNNISVTGISNVTISVVGTVPTANTVTNAAQPNITSVGTLTGLTSTGNITAPYFIGNVQGNIVGNIVVPGSEGDILFNQGGNAGASSDLNFNDITNTLTVGGSANVNILNVGEVGTSLVPTSNVTLDLGTNTLRWKDLYLAGNTIYLGQSTIAADNGNVVFSGNVVVNEVIGNGYALTDINGANVSGEVDYAAVANSVAGANVSGQVANALIAGTVYTNAQPNITTVGTLTNLDVAGNATVGNLRSDNLQYANGAPYVFTTNAAGLNTQVQFNDANAFAGSANFTFDKTSNTLTVTNIVGNGSGLTSLNGSNVTGVVANAQHAVVSNSANSVAGANVSGVVANAQHAVVSDSANSVAGANVSGVVANAQHAVVSDSANSVAGANVSGQVANALVAGTVYLNSQPNITSVGSLVSLDVDGDIVGHANITGDYILGNGAFLTGVGDFSAAKGYHGSFFSNVSQTIASTTTAYPITLNNTDPDSYGVAITSNSRVTFTYAGTYNIQYSIQFLNTDNSVHSASVWLRKNGVDVPDTTTIFDVTARHAGYNGHGVGAINYIVDAIQDDYFELIWQAESTQVSIEYIGPGTTPTSPATPSVIVTAMQVTNVQAATLSGDLTGNLVGNTYGFIGVGFINISGNIQGSHFSGNGSGLIGIVGANVTGEVSYAAVANSVAGANVSGEVAYAAVANSVAGANVSGQVAYAAVANSVAGANVSGQVAYAAVANSVAGANVSGQVANAIVAGTVYTNAQPNITSVGTLTDLSVSGNATVGNLRSDNLQYANGSPYVFTTNAAGTNTQVQFNDGNLFAGSANFTFNKTSNTLSVTNIVANGSGLTSLNGANVTGQVSYAAVANSVAVGNVSGIGNIAVINLDGNVSNVLKGDGTWGVGGGGGTPGGSNTELQFNNNGSFGGISTVTYDGVNLSLGSVANIKIAGGGNYQFIKTDGTGNLAFQPITNTLTVGTRSTAVNIGITNYTMNVESRTGNVTVNVN